MTTAIIANPIPMVTLAPGVAATPILLIGAGLALAALVWLVARAALETSTPATHVPPPAEAKPLSEAA